MDKRSVLDRRCYVVGIFWLLLIALASVALAAPSVLPKPSSLAYSVDTTGMITAEDAAKIAEMGRGLDAATGAQVVVVTIPSLDGASIEEYATTLFRDWASAMPRRITVCCCSSPRRTASSASRSAMA